MNETQEGEMSIRLFYVLLTTLLLMFISGLVFYHLGKEQAYKEIVNGCVEHKIPAAFCLLASRDTSDETLQVINEVLEEEIAMMSSKKKV